MNQFSQIEIDDSLNSLDPEPGDVQKKFSGLISQQIKLKIFLEQKSSKQQLAIQFNQQDGVTQVSREVESFRYKQETYQSTGLLTKQTFINKLTQQIDSKPQNYNVHQDQQEQLSQFEKLLYQQESENTIKQLQQLYGLNQEGPQNKREINQMYQLNRKMKNISKNSNSMNQLGANEAQSLNQYNSKRSNFHETSKQIKSILKRTSLDCNTKSECYSKKVRFSVSTKRPRMVNLE